MNLKWKICGMREAENIRQVAQLHPDFMGFVFYPPSPRYAGNMSPDVLASMPTEICKTGVFVDAKEEEVLQQADRFGLNAIQLHGHESPDVCRQLRLKGFVLIKAFPVAEADDFVQTAEYEGCCDYFLFDTKTAVYGGSGQKFDWTLLSLYNGNTPFLLSGGIDLSDLDDIELITHPLFAGVDLNSRFELQPAIKDINRINDFCVRFYSSKSNI